MSQAINLPLEKYCRTSGNFNGSRPKWLVDDALAVIVQKHTSSFDIDAEVSLKVMQGDHLLDLVPLSQLCGQAADTISRRINQRVLISALIRCPSLAITYCGNHGEERSFQMKMKHATDFWTAVGVLKQWGCPVKDAEARPATSATVDCRSNDARFNTSKSSASNATFEPARPASAAASFAPKPTHRNFDDLSSHGSLANAFSQDYHLNMDLNEIMAETSSTVNRFGPSTVADGSGGLGTPASMLDDRFPSSAPQIGLGWGSQHDSNRLSLSPLKPPEASQILPPRRVLPFPEQAESASPTKKVPTKRKNLEPLESNKKRPAVSKTSTADSNSGLARVNEQPNGRAVLSSLDTNGSGAACDEAQWDADTKTSFTRRTTSVLTEIKQMATLQAYASKPTRERQIIIDSLISSYIGDDSFLSLCEDVENAWRRIGLNPRPA